MLEKVGRNGKEIFNRHKCTHRIYWWSITKTISIRKTKKIKLPDALLAATAIINDFTLLTRNVDDFVGIDDLKIENPWNW
ncbi:MAG: hypothetical protein REI64_04465 [Pedobacter sp.]|nr:hypothetical protein [Pedobacter sp.]